MVSGDENRLWHMERKRHQESSNVVCGIARRCRADAYGYCGLGFLWEFLRKGKHMLIHIKRWRFGSLVLFVLLTGLAGSQIGGGCTISGRDSGKGYTYSNLLTLYNNTGISVTAYLETDGWVSCDTVIISAFSSVSVTVRTDTYPNHIDVGFNEPARRGTTVTFYEDDDVEGLSYP